MRQRARSWVIIASGLLASGCATEEPAPTKVRPSQFVTTPSEPEIPMDPDQISVSLADSVHAGFDCIDCHLPARPGSTPKARASDEIEEATCDHCHTDAAVAYAASAHGVAASAGSARAATCADCHGNHDIYPTYDSRSLTYGRRLSETCGRCHQNPDVARALGIREPDAGHQYLESIHGRALVTRGLLQAPSCADCHGHEHTLFRREDPRSSVHRNNLAATCGACHEGPEQAYSRSTHARAVAAGNPDAPTCSACHTAHRITEPTQGFRLESDELCGRCHQDRLRQYFLTYHGRAHHLGSADVAACFDCHGNHDIRSVEDPAASISPQRRIETCRECHPGAPERLASFQAHGDHTDRQNYPLLYWAFVVMTSLIVGTFAIWGLHTLLWMSRTLAFYLKDPAGFRAAKQLARSEKAGRVYVRFQPIDRYTHLLVIVSFMILVATGMPLRFHETAWARFVFDLLGGPENAARLHRLGALLSFAYLGIHLTTLAHRAWRNRAGLRDEDGKLRPRRVLGYVFGPDSPLPNLHDLEDARQHTRWFFGRGPKPRFDRFTYWEKFDYFAELWGSAFIGVSGLVMWLPTVFTRVLPGWFINLAQVVHSQEALLAAGFILTFHFFNSHFRLEKFPMDTVIFSGRITEEELKHERGRQYDRLLAEGRLEELKARDTWETGRWVLPGLGALALVVGLGLAAGIFYAILRYGLG